MTGWAELFAVFALFLASHVVPARPPVRARLVRWLGERGYLGLYIGVSIAVLAWLIVAAGRAPYVALWDFALWHLWVPMLAMPAACTLAAFGVGAANPLSIAGGRAADFDPQAPGIAGVTRHPLLWALALWSGSHVVPNGDLAHVLLFGSFTLFALIGARAIDCRLRRRLGAAEWDRLARRTSFLPFAAWVAGRWRPRGWRVSAIRLGVAVALYLTLVFGHPWAIGVSPWPVI